MNAVVEPEKPNAAWVEVASPLSRDGLLAFIRDVERLLRINPLLEFERWERLGEGRYRMRVKNLVNERSLETEVRVVRIPRGLRLRYDQGLKEATDLEVADDGARLTITEHYQRLPEAEMARREDELDRSLVPWGSAIHRYLKTYRRWGRLPLWRWYMRRVWQPSKPLTRRIVKWVLWVTVLEFVAFLFVLLIFALEQGA